MTDIYKWVRQRWIRLIVALLWIILAYIVLVYPYGYAKQEVYSIVQDSAVTMITELGEGQTVVQEFKPAHKQVSWIALQFDFADAEAGEGNLDIRLEDADGSLVYQSTISCSDLEARTFYRIPIYQTLKTTEVYRLQIALEEGKGNGIAICSVSKQDAMKEQKGVSVNGQAYEGELVAWVRYDDAILLHKILIYMVFLLGCAAILLCGMPFPKLHAVMGWGLLLIGPAVLTMLLELMTHESYTFCNVWAPIFNIMIVILFWTVLYLLTHSIKAAVSIGAVSVTALYFINYFVTMFRGIPFRLNDIFVAGTAAAVAQNYSYTWNLRMIHALGFAAGIIMAVWSLRENRYSKQKQRILSVSGIVLGIGMVLLLVKTDIFQYFGIVYQESVNSKTIYDSNGFLVAFCQNIYYSKLEKPRGYSREQVQAAFDGMEIMVPEGQETEQPHIILVMNESFTDLGVLGNVAYSEEPLAFYKTISENSIKGYLHSSVYGGETANSEFEVLTGCAMAFLPKGYCPYMQCFSDKQDSMVSVLKEQGYYTIAMHPERASNYNRTKAYDALGFDEMHWKQAFEDATHVGSQVSDLSTYEKVIELYEKRQTGEKLFIWNLTMQNHSPYNGIEDISQVKIMNANTPQADNFASLIKVSDEALEQLIAYFAKQEEKVAVAVFGDHQPEMPQEFYNQIYAVSPEQTETEKLMNKYKTPFLLWTNYPMEEENGIEMSMNYFGAYLLEKIGVTSRLYDTFILQTASKIPVITQNGYYDSQGNFYELSQEGPYREDIEQYKNVQYNYLFDKQKVEGIYK